MSRDNPWAAREARESKPAWQRLLESTGGTALITVLIGGVAGQWITATFQEKNKEREMSLAAYSDYVKQEQDIVKRAYELIGTCVAATDDLMVLPQPAFNLDSREGGEKKKLEGQREDIRSRYNDCDLKWRRDRETLGLLMAYFHHGQMEVTAAWRSAEDNVSHYMDCARMFYISTPSSDVELPAPCVMEQTALRQSLDALSRSFESARGHAFEVPTNSR